MFIFDPVNSDIGLTSLSNIGYDDNGFFLLSNELRVIGMKGDTVHAARTKSGEYNLLIDMYNINHFLPDLKSNYYDSPPPNSFPAGNVIEVTGNQRVYNNNGSLKITVAPYKRTDAIGREIKRDDSLVIKVFGNTIKLGK